MTLVWASSFSTQVSDPDAQAYIEAVETQDTQPLEVGVAHAINTFVLGCKADGIWDAIKASCILAGARTLSGALVPLKGTAPTNFNFVSGDYNRETGLVGDGSTKRLNSNRGNAADPQNNQHLACYASVYTSSNQGLMGGVAGAPGSSNFGYYLGSSFFRSRNSSAQFIASNAAGLIGVSRSASNSFIARIGGSNTSVSMTSQTPNYGIDVFRDGVTYSDSRLSFYSIGEALDLALLDNRVSTLMTDIGAAIP
jgi:hypothetical protein